MTDTTPDTTPDPLPAVLQIDAARLAGVSVRTIQRAIDRGDLPVERDGRHCWVRLDDLDRWQTERTTRRATSRVVAHDTDVSHDATVGMSHDATRRIAPHPEHPDGEVERLQRENADLRLERDRWHQAFERESALREEETRQLRTLIQQEQALSFSRLAAIEATTRHDATAADATPERGSDMPAGDFGSDTPGADPTAPNWRRWWRRMTGGG